MVRHNDLPTHTRPGADAPPEVSRADLADAPADPGDIETAFAAAVVNLLEGDSTLLRFDSRRRLLDLAARMGIAPFEANLLIERARYRASADSARAAVLLEPGPRAEHPLDARRLRRAGQWAIAVAAALAVDAALVVFLLML